MRRGGVGRGIGKRGRGGEVSHASVESSTSVRAVHARGGVMGIQPRVGGGTTPCRMAGVTLREVISRGVRRRTLPLSVVWSVFRRVSASPIEAILECSRR